MDMKKSIEFILMTVITVSFVYWPTAQGETLDSIKSGVTIFFQRLDELMPAVIPNESGSAMENFLARIQANRNFIERQLSGGSSSSRGSNRNNRPVESIKSIALEIFNNRFNQKIQEGGINMTSLVFVAYHMYRKNLLDQGIPPSNIPLLDKVERIFRTGDALRIEFSRLVMFEIEDLFEKFDWILGTSSENRSAVEFLNCVKRNGFNYDSEEELPSLEYTPLGTCANTIYQERFTNMLTSSNFSQTNKSKIAGAIEMYYFQRRIWNQTVAGGELPLYDKMYQLFTYCADHWSANGQELNQYEFLNSF